MAYQAFFSPHSIQLRNFNLQFLEECYLWILCLFWWFYFKEHIVFLLHSLYWIPDYTVLYLSTLIALLEYHRLGDLYRNLSSHSSGNWKSWEHAASLVQLCCEFSFWVADDCLIAVSTWWKWGGIDCEKVSSLVSLIRAFILSWGSQPPTFT